jgi:hypothetical protein
MGDAETEADLCHRVVRVLIEQRQVSFKVRQDRPQVFPVKGLTCGGHFRRPGIILNLPDSSPEEQRMRTITPVAVFHVPIGKRTFSASRSRRLYLTWDYIEKLIMTFEDGGACSVSLNDCTLSRHV